MGCGESRERRDTARPASSSSGAAPQCGLCESDVHPADRCAHSCGQNFHTICFDSLLEGGAGARCPRCQEPLIVGVDALRIDGGRRRGGGAGIQHRHAGSAALFRALITELEAMRRVLDAQERAVATPPPPLDPALQPRPVDADALGDDDDCPICQEPLRSQPPQLPPPTESSAEDKKHQQLLPSAGGRCVQLPCRHAFHSSCAQDWLQLKRECPLCRAEAHPTAPAAAAAH